jgi:hypothetical protein
LNTNEDEAIAFLEHYDAEYGPILNQYVLASWNYETNLTDENAMAVVSISYISLMRIHFINLLICIIKG